MSRKQACLRPAGAGQPVDQRPRGLAERHGAWAGLGVGQIDGVVADIAPAEIEHFTPAASGERQQPDGGDGASKLTGNEMMVVAFANWGYAGWFMYVVGAVEISSVVAVLIPRIAAFGGLWLGALMAGALGTHFVNAEYVEWIPAGVLLGLPLTLAFLRRDSIQRLLGTKASGGGGAAEA